MHVFAFPIKLAAAAAAAAAVAAAAAAAAIELDQMLQVQAPSMPMEEIREKTAHWGVRPLYV